MCLEVTMNNQENT